MMSSFFFAVVLILSLMAVQSPGMVQFDESTSLAPYSKLDIIDGRKGRFVYSTTVTVIVLSTKTISSVSTTLITTKKTCAVLASGVTINGITTLTTTPTAACRRRRLYWDQPVFVAFQGDDNLASQFHEIDPSQVLRFEPTMLVEPESKSSEFVSFRRKTPSIIVASNQNNHQFKIGRLPSRFAINNPTQTNLEPSFDRPVAAFRLPSSSPYLDWKKMVRTGQPIFFGKIFNNNLFTKTSTSTSTVSYYTSTSTSTSYTATSSFFVAGACYPTSLTYC